MEMPLINLQTITKLHRNINCRLSTNLQLDNTVRTLFRPAIHNMRWVEE